MSDPEGYTRKGGKLHCDRCGCALKYDRLVDRHDQDHEIEDLEKERDGLRGAMRYANAVVEHYGTDEVKAKWRAALEGGKTEAQAEIEDLEARLKVWKAMQAEADTRWKDVCARIPELEGRAADAEALVIAHEGRIARYRDFIAYYLYQIDSSPGPYVRWWCLTGVGKELYRKVADELFLRWDSAERCAKANNQVGPAGSLTFQRNSYPARAHDLRCGQSRDGGPWICHEDCPIQSSDPPWNDLPSPPGSPAQSEQDEGCPLCSNPDPHEHDVDGDPP